MGLFVCMCTVHEIHSNEFLSYLSIRAYIERKLSNAVKKQKSKYMNSTNRPHPSTVIRRFALVRMI